MPIQSLQVCLLMASFGLRVILIKQVSSLPKPEEYGMFYQWNRKMAWSNISEISDWDISDEQGDVWTNENDPCPKGWRVPTNTEFETLANENKVSYEWMDNRQGALLLIKSPEHPFFFQLPDFDSH